MVVCNLLSPFVFFCFFHCPSAFIFLSCQCIVGGVCCSSLDGCDGAGKDGCSGGGKDSCNGAGKDVCDGGGKDSCDVDKTAVFSLRC